ncbi:hypothetical protein SF123566_6598, partial [Shigella flexneri 1235-66]
NGHQFHVYQSLMAHRQALSETATSSNLRHNVEVEKR